MLNNAGSYVTNLLVQGFRIALTSQVSPFAESQWASTSPTVPRLLPMWFLVTDAASKQLVCLRTFVASVRLEDIGLLVEQFIFKQVAIGTLLGK